METEKKIVELVEAAAVFAGDNVYTPEYKAKTPLEVRKIHGLGCAISKWARWHPGTITEVAAHALEDANYHSLASFLYALIEAMGAPDVDTSVIADALSSAELRIKIAASAG